MTGNKELFSSLDTSIQSEVKLGNDYKVKVNGKGVIVVYAKYSKRRTIHDVYYVPGLMCNLLGVGQLLKKSTEYSLRKRCALFMINIQVNS